MTAKASKRPQWILDHIQLYSSDPEKAHLWDSSQAGGSGLLPTLLLTTKGRQSGEERLAPLIYKKVDNAYVIIASKGGAPKHPAWYLNLVAQPDCEIKVGSASYKVKARQAAGAERTELWQQLAEIYPPYNDYQVRAGDRQIPVVVLDVAD